MRTQFLAATAADQLQHRIYLLIACLVVMFVIAIALALLASRLRKRKVINDLSELTGTTKGAQSGRDAQHVDESWWADQHAADGSTNAPASRWQQAILPPGSRPVEPPRTPTPSARMTRGSHRATASDPVTTPVPPPHINQHAPAAPGRRSGPPPIAPRPAPPQAATNPVVQPPPGPRAGGMFDGTDDDTSLGDEWFAQQAEIEESQ